MDSGREIDFPDYCLRGLRKRDYLVDGAVNTAAFVPDKRTAEGRSDNRSEVSINWEDNEGALPMTLGKREASGFGVARLAKEKIDYVSNQPGSNGALAYERAPLQNNPYHGNLLFFADLKGPRQKMIAAALALAAEHIPRTD